MIKVDKNRLKAMLATPLKKVDTGDLCREGDIFFVGGQLPVRETLETIFDSHCQSPAELFKLTFAGPGHFQQGVQLARQIKRNFSSYLLGRVGYPLPPHEIERTYAAGVDFIEFPIRAYDREIARGLGIEWDDILQSLRIAVELFPRWSVATTLHLGDEPTGSVARGIDFLLDEGILPLVEISPRSAHYPVEEMAAVFTHLLEGWESYRVSVKPLLPVIKLTMPVVDAGPKGLLRGFIDKVHDRRRLAASDLRRSLRVRQVEESFESAGL